VSLLTGAGNGLVMGVTADALGGPVRRLALQNPDSMTGVSAETPAALLQLQGVVGLALLLRHWTAFACRLKLTECGRPSLLHIARQGQAMG